MRLAIKNRTELFAGLLMMSIGVVGLVLAADLPFGSLRQMSSGFFPMVLSGLLTLFGILIAVPAIRFGTVADAEARSEDGPILDLDVRVVGSIVIAIFLFGLLIDTVGLAAAVTAAVIASALALRGYPISTMLLLSVGMTAFLVLLFVVLLRMPFKIWSF